MVRLRESLPHFTDEVLAFLLISIGLLSFLTLLSPGSGALVAKWSDLLTRFFGVGAYVVTTAIFVAGVLLLVPYIGITVRLNWRRLIAGEIFFVLALAYTHAIIRAEIGGEAGKVEAFARALEGQGGGLIGWAIQDVIHLVVGDFVTGFILIAALIVSGALTLGINRQLILDKLADVRRRWAATRQAPQAPVTHPEAEEVSLPPLQEAVAAAANPEQQTFDIPAMPVPVSARRHETKQEKIERMKNDGEITYRFSVETIEDRKRIQKRSDELPPLEVLETNDYQRPDDDEINYAAQVIERTVGDFGMQVEVIGVKVGPTVTQYAVQPFTKADKDGQRVVQRVRVTRVASLAQDISLALEAKTVRIQAPVPGTNYIGVEVPNSKPGIVSLRPVLESAEFFNLRSPLALALGRQVDGRPFAADLVKMPHLLIGGTTGSGKSVALRSIAMSLVLNNTPDDLRLILCDPKMVEMIRFNGLPHLMGKVEFELERIIGVLRWVTQEMDRRYKMMEEEQARNIVTFNKGKRRGKRLPYIVVIIDELAELMTEMPDQTEHLITRLAQMARATGIHLVVATQRPSTDVVTGLIKANFPARVAFAVASGTDSRVILDSVGAEDLIGNGDMLYQASDAAGPIRLQGCFVSDDEIEQVVEHWIRASDGKMQEDDHYVAPWERALTRATILNRTDPMLEEAIRLVQKERVASASYIQRKLNIGYPRAGRIMDVLYKLGIVGEEETGGRTRKVLISPEADPISYIVDQRHSS